MTVLFSAMVQAVPADGSRVHSIMGLFAVNVYVIESSGTYLSSCGGVMFMSSTCACAEAVGISKRINPIINHSFM